MYYAVDPSLRGQMSVIPRKMVSAVNSLRVVNLLRVVFVNCGLRGRTGGAKPGSGVQRFWGPLGASEFDPSFQKFGVSETPSQRPLRAPERLSGPRGRLFRGLGEGCPFSTERENKVGHSEASKRPRFPGCPLRGFQPSGSYPQATDKLLVRRGPLGNLLFLSFSEKARIEKDTTPYKSLRARSPPRSARESVPEKRGVPGSV